MRRFSLGRSAWLVMVIAAGAGLIGCGDAGGDGGDPPMDFDESAPAWEGGENSAQAPPQSPDEETEETFTCVGLDESGPKVLYLSADDSNSMGSPAHVREMLRQGAEPHPYSIRTYEFLNYYGIAYDAAPEGELRIVPQMQAGAEAGFYDLQIGVRAPDAALMRRPMTLTFVLDTSGSMQGEPMERQQAAVRALGASLAEGDIVNLVTWNTTNATVLSGHMVNGPDDPQLEAAVAGLSADGGTDLENGLAYGYDLAQQHYGAERINRLILISDGGANVGVTSAELIAKHSADADQEGIYLVGVGTGPADGYDDMLMDAVTDKGRGAYVYLDSVEEAWTVLHDRFDETMEVAARGVQVELTLPWYFRIEKFYGEEYSEDAEEIEPQHLAPGDAMIFNQVVRACDAELIDLQDPVRVTARWQTPLTYEEREATVETTVAELLEGNKAQLLKGNAIIAYAEALKDGSHEVLQAAHDTVVAANPEGTDPELSEIADLLEMHPAF
ncbi:vWA domain-containing protein [Chondromyces apiculatus]|uniref:von Willebrand factor type A domain protein n=1 Tax=Chondromyces apiculatus DSM 436 TaxID=1192034 RepID=A0A017T7D3_9BACT|nr:VWA domain-containing protein [Chondromyces apiculatus]EYF04491.1 Von Willebrand factor type A domain protein [Chondromyces apiculatus DSM 436]